MKISNRIEKGRKVWDLDNDAMVLTVMEGGGHISGLRLRAGPDVNPFWVPIWKSIEPWQYRPCDAKRYSVQLLAAIRGHNLCLSAFGTPSPEEERAGLGNHGEAPVLRWRTTRKKIAGPRLTFAHGCRLPIAEMDFERTLTAHAGSSVFHVKETVRNLARRDVPFTMCEHVTFGPPFLQRGVTLFDMSATRGHTLPEKFGDIQRMKINASFTWPNGPGYRGVENLRTLSAKQKHSDFSTQRMNPAREHAWFSALNPKQGLLIAYVWRRADFPWLGNWEENHARRMAPWLGKSLTRGMEFSNSPYPIGVRKAVTLGKLFGTPTYAWLPARATVTMEFSIIARTVDKNCKGVADIVPIKKGFAIDLIV